MLSVYLIVQIRRETGMKHNVRCFHASSLQIEEQPPGERASCRRHLGRPRLARVDRLIVIKAPGRRYIFIPDRAPDLIERVDQFASAFRKF